MIRWNSPFASVFLALRRLRKTPVFSTTVIATLAVCIGVNTAIYSIVDTLFFRALPYPDPGRLVLLTTISRKNGASDVDTAQTGEQWELIRDHANLLSAAVYSLPNGANLFAGGHAAYIRQERVSANFFRVLGVHPLLGREFTRQEDVPGGPRLVILSYGLWRAVFHGNPAVVGRSVDLRGAPYTVVGVMPNRFRTDSPADLWTPLEPSRFGEGSADNYGILARLAPGATFAQADAQLNSVMRGLFDRAFRHDRVSMEERLIPLQSGMTMDLRSRVNLMWGAVGLVLLIGCVNIAGLLLARSASRTREVATRLALGASRGRVVRELLAEALLLALAGGLAGLLVGQFTLQGLLQLNPDEFQLWTAPHLDVRVAVIMLGVGLFTALLFGLFPALEATSVDLRSALAEAGRSAAGSRRLWKRQALVFVEVALGFVLIAGAGLLLRSLTNLMDANPGFDPNHVMTASVSLQDVRYQTATAGARLFRETLQRIRRIPGVESAAVALTLPDQRPLYMPVQQISGSPRGRVTGLAYATPGLFATLRIPILRGRVFTPSDNTSAARVAVVNEAFLDRFHVRDPLGALVSIMGSKYQIVGVVANTEQKSGWGAHPPTAASAEMYLPVDQVPDNLFMIAHTWFAPSWIVRTHGNVGGLPEKMRQALSAVDPTLPFSGFHSMLAIRSESFQTQRYQAVLFGSLGALALGLAALGIYGLIAQSVAQRTREMGIRLALGANVQDIVRSAAAPGIVLSLTGIAAGLVLALLATRLLKGMVWGIATTDPVTFFAVAGILLGVAIIASILPALRLTHLDPAQTLREE